MSVIKNLRKISTPDGSIRYEGEVNGRKYEFSTLAELDMKLKKNNVTLTDAQAQEAALEFAAVTNPDGSPAIREAFAQAELDNLEWERLRNSGPSGAPGGNLDLSTSTQTRARDSGTTTSSQPTNIDAVEANPADVAAFKKQPLDDQIKMADNAIEDTNKIDPEGERYKQAQKDNPDKLPEKPENMTTAQKIAFGLFMLTMGLGYYNKDQKAKREKCEKQCKPAGQSLSMWAAESVTKDDLSNPSGNDFLTDCYETTCWNSSATVTGENFTGGTYCSAANVDTHTACTTKCEEACKKLYPDLSMEEIIANPSLIPQEIIPAAVTGLAEDAAQAAADAANAAIDAAKDVGGNLFGGAFKVIMIIVGVIVGLVVLGLLGYAASKSGGNKKTA